MNANNYSLSIGFGEGGRGGGGVPGCEFGKIIGPLMEVTVLFVGTSSFALERTKITAKKSAEICLSVFFIVTPFFSL